MKRRSYIGVAVIGLFVLTVTSLYFANGLDLQGRLKPTSPGPKSDSVGPKSGSVVKGFSPTLSVEACSLGTTPISIGVDAKTPKEDIAIAGDLNVSVSTLKLTGVGGPFTVDSLKLMNRYKTGAGDADNNISSVTLSYENEDGAMETKTSYLVAGEAKFTGMDIFIPEDDSVKVDVTVDMNDSSTITSGELIELFPLTDGANVVDLATGTSYGVCANSPAALLATNPMHVYETKPTFSLSSSSPSGPRSVSSTDDAFIFSVAADSEEEVTIKDLTIKLSSDADFNMASGQIASLKSGSTTLASAPISVSSSSKASVSFSAEDGYSLVEIAKGASDTLTFQLDSATLMDEDAGVDDPLTVSIDLGSSLDGKVTVGGIVWNDTNADAKWLGYLSSTVLTGNTLLY